MRWSLRIDYLVGNLTGLLFAFDFGTLVVLARFVDVPKLVVQQWWWHWLKITVHN